MLPRSPMNQKECCLEPKLSIFAWKRCKREFQAALHRTLVGRKACRPKATKIANPRYFHLDKQGNPVFDPLG